MKRFRLTALAAAISIAFAGTAVAASMSKETHQSTKAGIEADYKAAKQACGSLSANPKDICMAEAKGKENVALADLKAAYEPSADSRHDLRVAKAEATYAVAKEKCDDKAGNAKDVCVKEAKADLTAAKADAKAQMKTADANATASDKTVAARDKANKQVAEARKDANTEKRDAAYAVAKEKCDALAGNAKDTCVNDAKVQYGKS